MTQSKKRYEAVWIRPEVFKKLKAVCEYEGTPKNRFTEKAIREQLKKSIYIAQKEHEVK